MNKTRIEKLVNQIKLANLDGLLISPSEDLNFLTGFTPMLCARFQGMFITAGGQVFYVCNRLTGGEMEHAYKGEVKVFTWKDGESMTDVARTALTEYGLIGKTLGINKSAQGFNVLDIQKECDVKFVNGVAVIEEARIIKTPAEQDDMRRSAGIVDNVFEQALGFIKPGMNEMEIFQFLSRKMLEAGGLNPTGIVASGPNSSYPHYTGKDRIIKEKDFMILDYGCALNGMRSDMSRTIFVGGISEEEKKIYGIVREASDAGKAAAVNGAFIPDVDKAARNIIEEAGYGENFLNRLGHGIGYMTHEAPDIKKNNRRNLEPGMAFSIEPGIYLAGHIGMRIEDIVLVTEKGNEVLNKANRDIIII